MLRRKARGSNSTQPALAPVPAENADHLSSPAVARGPSAVQIPIQIDLACDRALHEQIGEQIRFLISGGKLRPGCYIPSTRQLAEHLGVSRNTVLLAYQRFASEDHTSERQFPAQPQALLGEHELFERGRSLGQHGHSFPHQQPVEILRRAAGEIGHHHNASPVEKCAA